jgi:O-antigen ligase
MRRLSLETLAITHAALLLIAASWALGGNIAWARTPLAIFGSLGAFITLAAIRSRRATAPRSSLAALHFLWPLLGYNALILLGAFQPTFTRGLIEGAEVLIPLPEAALTAWPCSAQPAESLRQLWLFNALFLPAFNLLLAVREPAALRTLLIVVALNATGLAVFGTFQKLLHAPGLFFGARPSPNKTFFATFIYHNHWGAFAILMLAATLGLVFHAALRPGPRGFWHSPAPLGIIAALALAASAPLSTSRSCTALVILLLLVALGHAWRRARISAETASPRKKFPLGFTIALLLGVGLAGYAIHDLARPMIAARATDTREQLAALRDAGDFGARAQLYGDTWRMFADRPWFGWGLGSYPAVFPRYNSQKSTDNLPVIYVDAHSDWLQSLAETGVVGAALLGALIGLPAWSALRRPRPTQANYLLLGCALLLFYAWIEFPFGCPAVIAAFWLCLFSAVRLTRLETRARRAS